MHVRLRTAVLVVASILAAGLLGPVAAAASAPATSAAPAAAVTSDAGVTAPDARRPRSLAGIKVTGYVLYPYRQPATPALYFVNGKYVVTNPRFGLPKCTRATKECRPYRYAPATGKLKVGKRTGVVRSAKNISLGGVEYSTTLTLPKAGATPSWFVTYGTYQGCGDQPACFYQDHELTLRRDGTYFRQQISIGGRAPKVTGTYAIGKRGKITFRPKNGTVQRTTLAIFLKNGKPAPEESGTLIFGDWYVDLYFD